VIAPQIARSAGMLMVGAGALHVLIGAVLGLGLVWFAGPCCCVGVVPLACGLVELFVGRRIASGEPTRWAPWVSAGGIVVGLLTLPVGGFLSMTAEILATVSLRDPDVRAWLAPPASADGG
jgi:hypothetical protein